MSDNWDGKLRRADDKDDSVQTRLAVLEYARITADRHHAENRDSLIAIHARVTQLGKDFEAALSKGLDAIMDKMESQNKLFTERSERITKLESAQIWFERSLYGLGSVGILISAWIFNHGDKAK